MNKQTFYVKEESELHTLLANSDTEIKAYDEVVLLQSICLSKPLIVTMPLSFNIQNHAFISNGYLQIQKREEDACSFCIEFK